MAGFDEAFERLIGHEGGYVNHPDDPGGETKWGITRRTARAEGYQGDMKSLARDDARTIYKRAYWERARCDQYDEAVAFQLFDISVNHGIGNGIRMLQRSVGVADDGIVGPITLAAIHNMNVNDTLMLLNSERLSFYTRLSTWDTFGRGWANRVAENLRYAAQDNGV